jgi:hypothetical protein
MSSDTVQRDLPFGKFSYTYNKEKQVFILKEKLILEVDPLKTLQIPYFSSLCIKIVEIFLAAMIFNTREYNDDKQTHLYINWVLRRVLESYIKKTYNVSEIPCFRKLIKKHSMKIQKLSDGVVLTDYNIYDTLINEVEFTEIYKEFKSIDFQDYPYLRVYWDFMQYLRENNVDDSGNAKDIGAFISSLEGVSL